MQVSTKNLLNICIDAASKAAISIKKIRQHDLCPVYKDSNDYSICTKADLEGQRILLSIILSLVPNIHQITEEDVYVDAPTTPPDDVPDYSAELSFNLQDEILSVSDLTLTLDPIDGTLSFFEGNLSDCSIMIGILKHNKPFLGVIYFPFLDVLNVAVVGSGCHIDPNFIERCPINFEQHKNKIKLATSTSQYLDLYESFGDDYACIAAYACGNKLSLVAAEGGLDAYHSLRSGLGLWDLAPGAAMLIEMGYIFWDGLGREIDWTAETQMHGVTVAKSENVAKRVLARVFAYLSEKYGEDV